MAEESKLKSDVLSKDAAQEVKKIVEERVSDIKRFIDKIKERRYDFFGSTDLLTLGVVFALGLALGVAISKKR